MPGLPGGGRNWASPHAGGGVMVAAFPFASHRTLDLVDATPAQPPAAARSREGDLAGLLECILPFIGEQAEQIAAASPENAAPLELWLSLGREALARPGAASTERPF